MRSPLLDLSTIPPYAGSTNPAFLFPDYMTLAEVQADAREPLSEAKRHRLVKGSKCPTATKPANFGALSGGPRGFVEVDGISVKQVKGGQWAGHTFDDVKATPEGQIAAYTVIQFRDWSDEYRISTRVETTAGTKPPEQCGPRISENLTPRAARKVAESCSYVALKKGGYRTFFTLTFDTESRAAIAAGETSIQKEVSRFMDGLQKMWRRGWVAEFDVNGRKMFCADRDGFPQGEPAQKRDLLYVWVAEAPDNDKGEINPHVHVLINWRVKYALFPAWAKRIESLWGQGVAHIEKIKDSEAAASYMMKAAGYLCKAQGKNDQGTIRGNRYGISAAARAPDWATLAEKQLHIMGRLIADVHDHLTVKYGELYNKRRALKQRMDEAPKGTKKRYSLGHRLQRVRQRIAELPIVASKYQVLLKGKDAFRDFMAWARAGHHWPEAAVAWLPEKPMGEQYRDGERPDTQWFAEFKRQHYWRRALRRIPVLSDLEFRQAANDYEFYAMVSA
ncbi:Uncharacterised protein [Zhongshania aliphaticivorans]|uniref:Replication-associated protein ORF2/G2P domain-containing protein n=1 Tax=Zhongshania aliphaticivorans TaxID=1470434 RepID=A0A5S9N5S0_9GAMM|nr:hypothetical protein [Zhongshania aliphaticivorans]CAA0081231.1 Uncharacterised protein [Zhongshania aliphaticivorans]CAA0085178.1 Uncharacterised protein [Zhongshania aliphaticivorans]